MKRHRSRTLGLAGLLSAGLHLGLVGAIMWRAQSHRAGAVAVALLPGDERGPVDVSPRDFLTAEERAALMQPAPPVLESSPRDPRLGEADTAGQAAGARAPRFGLLHGPGAPAADSGEGTGRRLPPSWRRDRSTLRARLTDGARIYQPSHERTGQVASSDQALRRETRVGIGDSSRTRKVGTLALVGASDHTLPPAAPGDATSRAQGPLDANQGRKSFDVEREGPARDSQDVRAASNESQPGLIDFSAAAAPGPSDGQDGHGPSATPGAVAYATRGNRPFQSGAPRLSAAEEAALAAERQYTRDELEIRRRISQVIKFPRRLALLLQQGETIVTFVVRANGRVAGDVRVVKSSGFDEFDDEAVAVVGRAAPFPAMTRDLTLSMRVPFQNPVIR